MSQKFVILFLLTTVHIAHSMEKECKGGFLEKALVTPARLSVIPALLKKGSFTTVLADVQEGMPPVENPSYSQQVDDPTTTTPTSSQPSLYAQAASIAASAARPQSPLLQKPKNKQTDSTIQTDSKRKKSKREILHDSLFTQVTDQQDITMIENHINTVTSLTDANRKYLTKKYNNNFMSDIANLKRMTQNQIRQTEWRKAHPDARKKKKQE